MPGDRVGAGDEAAVTRSAEADEQAECEGAIADSAEDGSDAGVEVAGEQCGVLLLLRLPGFG
jgi:hypothetical protein